MERSEYLALCRGVETGTDRFVEDVTTHTIGKVIACDGNRFQVELEGHQESWPSESCREKWGLTS